MASLDLVLGLYDDPEHQKQDHYKVDLYQNNIAIFGTSMSGKTTLIKTLLTRLHQVAGVTNREEIYILDFSNDLWSYQNLPYVMAYFDALHEENVRRIFKVVKEKYSNNMKCLHGKSFVQGFADEGCVHVTFIIDGLNNFMEEEKYGAYHDILQKLARDGLSKGITVIFTASDPSRGIHRLLPFFGSLIALDLPKDKYADLFETKVEKPIVLKGRGVAKLGTGVYEFQAYFPYDIDNPLYNSDNPDLNDEKSVQYIREALEKWGKRKGKTDEAYNKLILEDCYHKKLKSFSGNLTKENWKDYTDMEWSEYQKKEKMSPSAFTAGLDYYSFKPVEVELTQIRSIAIYGKKGYGKSNLLSLILEAAKEIPDSRFVFWEDGAQALTKKEKAPTVSAFIEKLGERAKIIYEKEDFENYLRQEGYFDLKEKGDMFQVPTFPINENYAVENCEDTREQEDIFQIKSHPFTIFVIQSRIFYQEVPGSFGAKLIPRLAEYINDEKKIKEKGGDEIKGNKLFVFSDVQRIVDNETRAYFNNCIDHAFLLDDIVRFVNDRGRNSVFESQDPVDLKDNFGPCELGDGYYLNLETGELKKLKFIQQKEE